VTSGFQAVRDDLRRAAGTFGTESVTLRTVMSPDGPEGTGGGSPRFDEALAQLLGAIGEQHLQLTAAIAAHGRKLREAWKHYQTAEESIGRMVDRIMDEGQPGTARS
jgi:hypothetical protein